MLRGLHHREAGEGSQPLSSHICSACPEELGVQETFLFRKRQVVSENGVAALREGVAQGITSMGYQWVLSSLCNSP